MASKMRVRSLTSPVKHNSARPTMKTPPSIAGEQGRSWCLPHLPQSKIASVRSRAKLASNTNSGMCDRRGNRENEAEYRSGFESLRSLQILLLRVPNAHRPHPELMQL